MPSFKTFNDMTIGWITRDGVHTVYIEGEARKPLYAGTSPAEAKATYEEAVAHYKERETNLDAVFTPRQSAEARAFRDSERLKRHAV